MKKFVLSLILLSFLLSCKSDEKTLIETGIWRAELQLTEQEVLPFIFEVLSKDSIVISNAEEKILVSDIQYVKDSIIFQTPVFEGYIKAKLEPQSMTGSFIKESLDRVVPFSAEYGKENRFEVSSKEAIINVEGSWEVVFSPDSDSDRYIAKGIFNQTGNNITGTFRTTTGDYRFLEGVMDGNTMKLSTFDGAHAFLFTAEVNDRIMKGNFYSGNHWNEPFIGKRNESFELPNPNDLTFLKDGYETLEFSFPDTNGNLISLKDDRFKDKVVIVQIMGTWCPNCLDESKYYSDYYNSKSDDSVEIVALAFEYAKTEEKAFQSIKRLKEDVGINYLILLAQYGTSSKQKAQEKLPMLNHVLSYPTSIFIDKQGKVRKIHTGFNGPATGEKFVEFKKEFTEFVGRLSSE